jgi:small-conductance mechanosensitive channel
VIAVFRKMYSLYVAYRHTFCGEAMPTQLTINIMNTKSRRSIEEYNKKVIVSIVVFRIIAITLYSILCLVNAYMGSDNFIVLFIMNPIYVLLIVAVNNSTCYTLMNEIFGV